jgi:DNA-binding CsgD family transcriptional regulator
MDLQITDRIYECSFVPDLWPGVLGELAAIASARTGFLYISNGRIHDFTASTKIGMTAIRPLVRSGMVDGTDRFRRMLAAEHAGFLVEHDIFTEEELRNDPTYRNVLYPRGLGWSTATAVPLPTGDCFTIVLEKEHHRGPVEASAVQALNELRPHLARSALLATRLQLERARAASETLAALGLPAVVFNDGGQVLAANPLIEAMTGTVRWLANDRMALKDRAADAKLRDAIATCHLAGDPGVRSFPARDVDTSEMMVAHVIPIRLSARDIFVRSAAALVLTPVTRPEAPPVELVRSLFDLTPTEAHVARGLAAGATIEHIASARGVARSTIRSHVLGVLEKTGCNRQADVVALLNGIWSPGSAGRE